MDAVAYWGQPLIDDPNRVGQTTALGVDETKFLSVKRDEATHWVSAICDVARRLVVDVIEGRQGPGARRLARSPARHLEGRREGDGDGSA